MENKATLLRLMCLYLALNKCPTIVKEVMEVIFPHLFLLKLSGNEIESIEGLNRIYMPALEQLWIGTSTIMESKIRSARSPI